MTDGDWENKGLEDCEQEFPGGTSSNNNRGD